MARSALRITLVTMAALGLALGTAEADNLYIDDLTEGQPTITTDGDPSKIQIQADSGPEYLHFFYTSTLPAAAGSAGTYSVDMLDPPGGDDPPGSLSDRLWLRLTGGSPVIEAIFWSDGAAVPAPVADTSIGSVVESGDYQVLATYIDLGSGAVIDTFLARSDVPEPSSLALAGVGLAALGGFAARRRRAAEARA